MWSILQQLSDPRVLGATAVAVLTPLSKRTQLLGPKAGRLSELDLGLGVVFGLLMWKLLGDKAPKSAWQYPALTVPKSASEASEHKEYDISSSAAAKKSFEAVGDMIIAEVTAELRNGCEMPDLEVKWVTDMLNYNVKGGKMNRGLMVVQSGVTLFKAKKMEITPQVLTKFAVLGWCIEWLQAFFLILDDIMDGSTHRRGQPCWYKVEEVKMIAINDGLIVEQLLYRLLKKHFGDEPYYGQLVDFFLETTFQTSCGQLLDTICEKVEVDDFTKERWRLVCKYKTAFYSFYCPVALGMIVAGVKDAAAFDAARTPLITMGIYFQAQDDFLDAFGTLEQLGKVGTDIQDRKCSWLFTNARDKLTPEQTKYMKQHYGKCQVGSKEEKEIKAIFEKVGLKDAYSTYEEKCVEEIRQARPSVEANGLPWALFEEFLNKIYKRSK
mmetsp:Transcript_57658/g.137141  ORF Transcript_57658/g.137141 Transcript_57658/m.137141 type:complete len:439 (-) Transcript_57658:108-1424(-)